MKTSKWCDCGAPLLDYERPGGRRPACERRHRRHEPKPRSVEARLGDWQEWHSADQLTIEDAIGGAA